MLPLQACCRGCAAEAMSQGLCCICSNCCTGHTDQHAPSTALATQFNMPQVLHWPRRSACSKCCTGHTDQQAPSVALAAQITMLQPMHWSKGSACSTCTDTRFLKVVGAQRGSVLNFLRFFSNPFERNRKVSFDFFRKLKISEVLSISFDFF